MSSITRPLIAASLFMLAGLPLSAGAQQPSDDAPLKGPSITERPSGKPGTFGDKSKKNANKKEAAFGSPMPLFTRAMDELKDESTPAAVRLSAAQSSEIDRITSEFSRSATAYKDQHRSEIESLRGKLSEDDRRAFDAAMSSGRPLKLSKYGFGGKGPEKGKGARNDNGDDAMKDDAPTPAHAEAAPARARLHEIYSGRPKAEDVQAKMLAVLRPEQAEAFQTELAELRGKGRKALREGAANGDRKPGAGKPGKGGAAGGKDRIPQDLSAEQMMNDPRVPERVREKLKGMTPEQRDEFVKQMRERRAAAGQGKSKPRNK